MIVDCHTHVGEIHHYGTEFSSDLQRAWGEVPWRASSLDDHWEAMRTVDKAIVLAFDAPAIGFVVPNEYVASYVSGYSEKLIGFASVDPNRVDAIERLEHAVSDLNLRGLKVGPIYQDFDPASSKAIALFRCAEKLDIPVLCHQGTTFVRNAPLELARPIQLDQVARTCPDLVLVIAHLGHPWCEETMAVIRKHPNLYADVSALHTRPFQLYKALIAAIEYRVIDKLLFGSDFPFATPESTIEALQSASRLARSTGLPTVGETAIDEIIHRDTLQLLGLD